MAKNILNSVKLFRPKVSRFNLTHDTNTSANMGILYPMKPFECVPGDKFRIGNETLVRCAPMVTPPMHRMDVKIEYFFVPYRILWENWEKFIMNEKVAGAVPACPFVYVLGDGSNYGPLLDRLGVPPPSNADQGEDQKMVAFALAAYQKIWYEFYRDQNLQDGDYSSAYTLQDGENTASPELFQIRRRCWEHDYFTSALPFAQKGDPVQLPIAGFQDVKVRVNDLADNASYTADNGLLTGVEGGTLANVPLEFRELFAETSAIEGTSTTINDLRTAVRLQEWLERNALGGTRYTENTLAHFGVRPQDMRLQRPEYITGMKTPIVTSEVLNTTGTADAPQGNMAGHGVAVNQAQGGVYKVMEHGLIMPVMSIMPKTKYMQGMPKQYLKYNDAFQYAWPKFANLGEQEVVDSEIYAYTLNGDKNTFGYQSRYAEYKFINNDVTGEMRSSLDMWHLARKFETRPNLNGTFVVCEPSNRIFSVTDPGTDHFYVHVLHRIDAWRPLPYYGTPTL